MEMLFLEGQRQLILQSVHVTIFLINGNFATKIYMYFEILNKFETVIFTGLKILKSLC